VKPVRELVDLPDHGLVHPLDVAEARRPFLLSWLLSVLTSPAVVAVLVVVLWFVARARFVAPLVGVLVFAAGQGAAAWYRREAWAFIPRGRQDRDRVLPFWDVARATLLAAAAGFAMCLLAWRLRQFGDIVGYLAGAYAGIALVVAVQAGWAARRGRLRQALLTLPGLAAVMVATLYAVLPGVDPGIAVLGAAVTVGVQAAWSLGEAYRRRAGHQRQRDQDEQLGDGRK
jgi:hypothetical protein